MVPPAAAAGNTTIATNGIANRKYVGTAYPRTRSRRVAMYPRRSRTSSRSRRSNAPARSSMASSHPPSAAARTAPATCPIRGTNPTANTTRVTASEARIIPSDWRTARTMEAASGSSDPSGALPNCSSTSSVILS
ncbi:hypothetical protein BJF83_03585 [Nocardiopsis sp. CNR-923]|nr:hypothetical protein BJF83_03585 [Nocardiopsis sp. CNR-923]